MFKSIEIEKWRQFEKIDIRFHEQLTILTGANGSGKTTILNILSSHFGWPNHFVGTPKKMKTPGILKFASGIWKALLSLQFHNEKEIGNKLLDFGFVTYKNGHECTLQISNEVGPIYEIIYKNRQVVKGLHILSHRPIYKYQAVQNLSTQIISRQNAFQQYMNSNMNRYLGNNYSHTENYYIKEALISLATFGYGNQVVTKNDEAIQLFEGFERILRIVLPPKIGFRKLGIRIPEVILECSSGDFSFDAVSGGIASIIDLAWQIYMYDDFSVPFVVTFDEPENHLHPEMQKTLLPNFLSAFPNTQFIVATHNPFIISSVPDSMVYVLNYNINNRIESLLLKGIEKSGSANDILRDVLGIDTTMPDWVNSKLESIISKYSDTEITSENFAVFKEELQSIGLGNYVSTSIVNLLEKNKKYDKTY